MVFEPEKTETTAGFALDPKVKPIAAALKETGNTLLYTTNQMEVKFSKSDLSFQYVYKKKPLIQESQNPLNSDFKNGFKFKIKTDEKLMGAGMRVLGMDRRGHKLRIYNKPSYGYETFADLMYYCMPLVISSNKFMLFFDNISDGELDLGASEGNMLKFEASGGRMAYTIVAAESWPDLLKNFTDITGRQALSPKWTLGNMSSRMGYRSQRQVEEVVQKFETEDIPLDAMILDLYWFGKELKGTLGNLDWHWDSFPTPHRMMSDLKAKGVKTILITEPFIIENTKTFTDAVKKSILGKNIFGQPYLYDFYFGRTGLIDIFHPKSRDWFWDIYRRHTRDGVSGWWGDLGEPEVHPDDIIHHIGKGRLVHNAYGHEWARMIYEGYRTDFPDQRPVILMRAGFIGSQRYGMIPWSGDVNRSWGGLKPQVEIGLSMGMQGLGLMHSDLGGFAGDYKDPELYRRWLQYGTFQPIYRTHAQEEVPPEPVYWDDQTKEIVRRYIKLRYALLPYNYTLLWINSTSGLPPMRPLFFQEEKTELIANTSEYLWGADFLVSPVTEQGQLSKSIYFPKGNNWIDFHTGRVYKGGRQHLVKIDESNIPVFVKAGALIPMSIPQQSTDFMPTDRYQVHFYTDGKKTSSTALLYDDDGLSPGNNENGQYYLYKFKCNARNNKLSIITEYEGKGWPGQPHPAAFDFILNYTDKKVQNVICRDKNGILLSDVDLVVIHDNENQKITIRTNKLVYSMELKFGN